MRRKVQAFLSGSRDLIPQTGRSLHISITAINLLFWFAFTIQMQFFYADIKPPILIDSEFTQPEGLQLHFWLLGKYAASTITSHIRIPFNYSGLLNLQRKLNDRLDSFFDTHTQWNSKISDYK